ncbi:MAG TPA: hypothetical protein VGU46_08180 [Acidobacteriaceae bacterium]|nr:hypothetical protein [Acidobacteriaceae bacterium]
MAMTTFHTYPMFHLFMLLPLLLYVVFFTFILWAIWGGLKCLQGIDASLGEISRSLRRTSDEAKREDRLISS